ncbi:hypothetical protein ACU4GI_08890 [Cupriavidus basilensis]
MPSAAAFLPSDIHALHALGLARAGLPDERDATLRQRHAEVSQPMRMPAREPH